jgi:FAD/FMN-containing dehydrogenase
VEPKGRLATPVEPNYRFYTILEAAGSRPGTDDDAFESALAEMFDGDLVADGAVAKSDAEREAIWAIRHEVEWVVRHAFIFDISLPVVDVYEYTEIITGRLKADIPDARVITFGHLGDNNIHISVLCDGARTHHAETIQRHVYESLKPYGGAISAEHGIGTEKMPWLPVSRSENEIELMRTLKRSLDPRNILNPGKVISLE